MLVYSYTQATFKSTKLFWDVGKEFGFKHNALVAVWLCSPTQTLRFKTAILLGVYSSIVSRRGRWRSVYFVSNERVQLESLQHRNKQKDTKAFEEHIPIPETIRKHLSLI